MAPSPIARWRLKSLFTGSAEVLAAAESKSHLIGLVAEDGVTSARPQAPEIAAKKSQHPAG
jgi:hypothetical protein